VIHWSPPPCVREVAAIKPTPSGHSLRFEVGTRNRRARVAVRDEDPGVDESVRDRIFEKFATAVVRNENADHFAGFCLAFCKLAVEAHGGRIDVEDGSPRGSVFAFEIPS
jgi:K+-sensing histidine kinase KdpD